MICLKPTSVPRWVEDGEPMNALPRAVSDGIGRMLSEVLLSILWKRGLYRRLIRLTSLASKGSLIVEFFLVLEIGTGSGFDGVMGF